MGLVLGTFAFLSVAALLWLNALATFAIRYDRTLNRTQKVAQTIIVWLVPIVGAGYVLYWVFEYYPRAIPRRAIPWPFRKMVLGGAMKPNRNGSEREIDSVGGAVGQQRAQGGADDAGGGD